MFREVLSNMSKNRRIKKVATVVATTAMIASVVPVSAFTSAMSPLQYVLAEEQNTSQSKARETIWDSVEIGEHDTKGSCTYENDGTIKIIGAGTKFDKDSGVDNLYYNYCQAKGDIVFTAKMNAVKVTDKASQAGIMIRNAADDAESQSEALYVDFGKNQFRYGRHGNNKNGASGLGKFSTDSEVYLRIELEYLEENKTTKVTYSVASQPDFSDAVVKQEKLSGIDAKTVGFFATEGTAAIFSDIDIKERYTTDDGEVISKSVYDSSRGELSLVHSTSKDYSGNYDSGNSFVTEADGNVLKVNHTRSATVKGNIREDKGMDYILFPTTTEDMTITADITINSVDSGTDKQGFAIGEFSTEKGSATAVDVLHFQKNKVFQHTYTSAKRGTGNCGDPKVSNIVLGTAYSVTYTKKADKADYKIVAADGTVILDSAANGTTIDLSADSYFEGLKSGNPVQYGFAFSGIKADLSNVKLMNSDGVVVYDMNDYYVAIGEAPQIAAPVAGIADDRESINISWNITSEGKGNIKYSVYVSKDGGAYTKAGDTKINSFSFKNMSGDGKYSFKVVPYGGDTKGIEVASNEVNYQTPLARAVLSAVADDKKVDLTWDAVEGATSYDVYKSFGKTGEKTLIKTVSEAAYEDSDVKAEEPYYYYVVAKNENNTGNPSATIQVLTSIGHKGEYVYENEAAKISVVNKDNDTIFKDKTSIAMKSDKAGTAKLIVNGTEAGTCKVEAGKQFSFDFALNTGRNDVDVLLTDDDNKTTRKTFNYVCNPEYDIVVDAAYTGKDGEIVDGHATYKTIQAAVNSVPETNAGTKVIFIKNGGYQERVEVKSPNISILGEDVEKTHLFYSVCVANGNADSMWNRNAMYVNTTAEGFTAENLTIENSYNYTNGNDQQADALCIVADKTSCVNVKLVGFQDTLLTDSRVKGEDGNYKVTRQYFEKCYITGNVDFIYGAGTSVFKDCDIVARYTEYKTDGCFTAGRTYASTKYGYVFDGCRFLAEDKVADGAYRMARPWGANDSTTFINCYLGRAISVAPGKSYGDMSGNLAANARFAEYGSYGPGYVVDNSRPLLTSEEVKDYTSATVMGDYDVENVINNIYKKVKPEEVKPDVKVNKKGDAPDVEVTMDADSVDLSDDEKDAVSSGQKINVKVEVSNKDNTVDQTEKEAINKKIAETLKDAVTGQFIDIQLIKQVGNASETSIETTKKPVQVKVTVPESLVNKDSSKTRKYSIARVHDGNIYIITGSDVVESEVNGVKYITFSSNEFSTYAIVYQDIANSTDDGKKDDDKKDDGKVDDGKKEESKADDVKKDDSTQQPSSDAKSEEQNKKSDESVATGDAARTGLFAIMAAIAGGIAAFAGKRKKEEE